jgi:hypothetical protein
MIARRRPRRDDGRIFVAGRDFLGIADANRGGHAGTV